jgi:hypothetical protein
MKAAECERAIRIVADPERRSVLISLRSLWIAPGNEESILDRSRQAGQVPKVAQIHAELISFFKRYGLTRACILDAGKSAPASMR